ncbi:MAG: prolipoprotein diacylglyceryl transferase [Anaerolineaceae bacterium]|nr:prolipoprotein diacylglyceryl transferase [Anaerolineaceae bacterium]
MPDGFFIGPLHIRYYGIIIMLGALVAAWLANREAKRKGEDPERVWDMLIWLLIAGIIGARLWHIFTPPASMVAQGLTTQYYLTHPLDAINTTKGGLGIPGAVIAGAVALFWYTRRNHLSFARWADIIAPGLALAQGIGRWGNFINQEVYGGPTNLPWAIYIDPAHRLPGFENVSYYHPLFLYESLYNLANMGFLLWIGRRYQNWLKDGDIFLIYLIAYPVFRFFMEFIRLDPSPVAGLDINQALMGVVALLSTAFLIYRHRKSTTGAVAEASPPDTAPEQPVSEEK